MMLPVLRLNRGLPSHSRQRCVMVLCLMPHWTLYEPQRGQYGPSGQMRVSNHARAASSSGNMRISLRRLIPSLWCLPGAFRAMAVCAPYESNLAPQSATRKRKWHFGI